MERIGVVSPEQMHAMWQDYLTRQQLAPKIRYNFPDRRPVEDVSPHRVKVKNTGSEIIPAFACMRITGVEDIGGQTCVKVEKPTSTDGEFLFNSQFAIAVVGTGELGVGWAYRHGVVTMLGDEPTEPGAAFGPIVGSWEIEEGGDKFVVFGRHDFSDRALVGRFNGGGGGAIRDGIVRADLGCGFYTIELGTFIGSPNDIPSASGSAGCNPCVNVTGEGTSGCGITISAPASKVVGSGQFETAYDVFSDKIPLIVGTDCLIALTSGTVAASGSGSGSGAGSGTTQRIWKVVNGYHEHVVKYEEDGSCCGTGGAWVTTRKKPTILVGHDCDWIDCEPCPSGSGSA